MRITCPACHAEASLDVLVGREADARAVSAFLGRHVLLGDVLLRYVALHRPAKRRLGLARMVSLIEELMPDIERGAIARKGRDWPTTPELWRGAIEQVLGNHAKGTLSLPLSGHGYLYEVLQGLSDKAEAQAERSAEAERRGRAHQAGPAKVANVAGVVQTLAELRSASPEGPSPKAKQALASVRQRLAERGMQVQGAAPDTPSTEAKPE